MITTVAEFIAENNKRKQMGLPSLNENFMDTDELAGDGVQEIEGENDDVQDDVQDELTLDAFKEALNTEFNTYMENLEEGAEEPEMLTDVQIELAFNACKSLCNTQDVQDEVQDDAQGVQDEEEIVEEGLFGPSKEEIEAGRKGAEERLKQLEAKFQGKEMNFMEKGDSKTVPYSFDAMMQLAEKNKFRGVIKSYNRGNVITLVYEPGKTLLQKLAAGTTNQTTGA